MASKTMEKLMAEVSGLREQQWAAMRDFNNLSKAWALALDQLGHITALLEASNKALFDHLEATTRPDGESPEPSPYVVAKARENAKAISEMEQVGQLQLTLTELGIAKNNKIDAINMVRARTNLGLKEAKDIVDAGLARA